MLNRLVLLIIYVSGPQCGCMACSTRETYNPLSEAFHRDDVVYVSELVRVRGGDMQSRAPGLHDAWRLF